MEGRNDTHRVAYRAGPGASVACTGCRKGMLLDLEENLERQAKINTKSGQVKMCRQL